MDPKAERKRRFALIAVNKELGTDTHRGCVTSLQIFTSTGRAELMKYGQPTCVTCNRTVPPGKLSWTQYLGALSHARSCRSSIEL